MSSVQRSARRAVRGGGRGLGRGACGTAEGGSWREGTFRAPSVAARTTRGTATRTTQRRPSLARVHPSWGAATSGSPPGAPVCTLRGATADLRAARVAHHRPPPELGENVGQVRTEPSPTTPAGQVAPMRPAARPGSSGAQLLRGQDLRRAPTPLPAPLPRSEATLSLFVVLPWTFHNNRVSSENKSEPRSQGNVPILVQTLAA